MTENSSEEYVRYRITRAHETLDEINLLLENRMWNTAISRMYYACFYAIGALLVKNGINVSSHSGLRQQFGQEFVKPGIIDKELAKHFSELFEKRQKGDYNDFFDFDEETANRLKQPTIDLIKSIEELL